MRSLFFLSALLLTLIACNNQGEPSSQEQDTSHASGHAGHNISGGATGSPMQDMHQAMTNMEQQMKTMKPTGDADYDFAMMMLHHHQSAIDMANAELAGGKDSSLKRLAKAIVTDQQGEIAVFNRYMQGQTNASGNSDYGQQAMNMMTPMSDNKMEGGSLDAMFASMMIPHHMDGVKMAEAYLKVGKNQELKQVAQNIVQTQPREVKELQDWLAQQKK